jgi:xanthine dehydrogenase accessory factor
MQDAPLKPFRFADAARMVRTGVPVAMVTIVEVKGSAPREPGIRMLVSANDLIGTIGGGHLEWRGMDIARAMLNEGKEQRRIERIPLGPALGQCCGGVVQLAFEVLGKDDLLWLDAVEAAFAAGKPLQRTVPALGAVTATESRAVIPSVTLEADGSWTDTLVPDEMHVVLFGAGHVGHALVKVLANLPCRVHWVDERDTLFPAGLPDNVEAEASDTPEAVVAQAPAGSYFLVMTHSHALDQTLCEEIFRRTDFAYFGLIGSKTKRARFEHRLADYGVDPARFPEMTCPMGVSGITDKAPAMIAVAIVAQLLQVRDQRLAALHASHGETVHP